MMVKLSEHRVAGSPGFRAAARRIVLSIATGAAVAFWSAACFAQVVSSAELIAGAAEYDGKTVIFQGEAIGDIMIRGEYAWVNVSDGANAIGIWMRAELAKEIARGGTYLIRGDTVKASGVFHRSCLQHGGDLDIHAGAVTIVASSATLPEDPLAAKAKFALGLAMILGVIWILNKLPKRYIPRFRP